MMHLPEAEIVRRELERDVVGRKIKSAEIAVAKVVRRNGNRTKVAASLAGAKIQSLERRGMHLIFTLDTEELLVIALAPTTLLLRNANRDKATPNTVATLIFTQQGQLRIVDAKNGVEMFLVPGDVPVEESVPELVDMGMDPLASPMSWTDFGRRILAHDTKLKSLLCDTSVMVGLGDIYSDEILFESSLRYDRIASSLNTQEVRRFFRSVVAVLNDAVKYRGTTIDGNEFLDPHGNEGSFQDHLQVYGKHGQLSPRSRQPLVRTKFSGRWTYYCDQSQV